METWVRVLLLTVSCTVASGCSWLPWRHRTPAQESAAPPSPPIAADTPPPAVIQPEVERREIKIAKIDKENWEVGVDVGSLSVEDFEVNPSYGLRLAYHISEDFFAEAKVGRTDAGLSSFERLSGSARLLTDSERKFTYYSLGFGWNFLPGEVFIGSRRAMPVALYVTSGVGSTRFAGDDRFTVTLGAGCRVLINDWLGAHLDLRDHMMEVDLLGTNKQTHNFEATLGLSVFF
jgi:outer membrane beta-barrel protein